MGGAPYIATTAPGSPVGGVGELVVDGAGFGGSTARGMDASGVSTGGGAPYIATGEVSGGGGVSGAGPGSEGVHAATLAATARPPKTSAARDSPDG
jgi:hypothetical protein